LKLILRPRTSKLLTKFDTLNGPKFVWTTFSSDQIDLNYRNPMVLLRVIEMVLFYARRGADIIRLDAVTYLWSELGTSCVHLEQTHQVIQLLRLMLDVVSPQVALITETNVPHEDNISYFGSGHNEAQMIYNFALPPMVVHTFQTGNCRKLSEWAARLDHVSDTATYFNFLASHDGIGLLAVREILTEEEIDNMIQKAREHGGMISYRTDSSGNKSPYEMNITWYSVMNKSDAGEPLDLQVDRYAASRSISLALLGVPGVYLPSLIGSENDLEAVTETGDARSINRTTFNAEALEDMLSDRNSRANRIILRLGLLFRVRIHTPAFHPNGSQKILMNHDHVFAVQRISPDGVQLVMALTNVSAEPQEFILKKGDVDRWPVAWENLFTGRLRYSKGDELRIELMPYQVIWLSEHSEEVEPQHAEAMP
jgi:sucrose phosphorylase